MFSNTARASSLRLAAVGAIAATALAGPPAALAATSGGAAVPANAVPAKVSAPFTIGLSATTIKPGAKLTVSGLAYARAGLNLTILSDAIMSGQTVNGIPAVQTPALVEGIYHTTVRVPPATAPGVYRVLLSFGNRQVASIRPARRRARLAHRRQHGAGPVRRHRLHGPAQRPRRRRVSAGRCLHRL